MNSRVITFYAFCAEKKENNITKESTLSHSV